MGAEEGTEVGNWRLNSESDKVLKEAWYVGVGWV